MRIWAGVLCWFGVVSGAGFGVAVGQGVGAGGGAVDAGKMLEMVEAARSNGTLEAPGVKGFHLMGAFETFDEKGRRDGTGTLEEFWGGDGRWKKVVAYPGGTTTTLHTQAGFVSWGDGAGGMSERMLLRGFYAPVPWLPSAERADLEYKLTTLGNKAVGCVLATMPKGAAAAVAPPRGIQSDRTRALPTAPREQMRSVSTFCMTTEEPSLRAAQEPPNLAFAYNKMTPLGVKTIAHEVTLSQGKVLRGKLTIGTLDAWPASDAAFAVPAGVTTHAALLRPDEARTTPEVVKRGEFVAPEPKISYTAVIDVVVGTDGVPESMEVVDSPNGIASGSAKASLKGWRWAPMVVDGTAVRFSRMMTMSFTAGGSYARAQTY